MHVGLFFFSTMYTVSRLFSVNLQHINNIEWHFPNVHNKFTNSPSVTLAIRQLCDMRFYAVCRNGKEGDFLIKCNKSATLLRKY